MEYERKFDIDNPECRKPITPRLKENEIMKTENTIDLTPSWEGILPGLLAAYASGGFEARKIAEEELTRMARIADAYVAVKKAERGEV